MAKKHPDENERKQREKGAYDPIGITDPYVPESGSTLPPNQAPLDADTWPDPLPLPDELTTLPKLTDDMLPPALRGWLSDIAARMQVPMEFPAVAALVSMAALIGRKLVIRPKRHDDWSEVGNLWGLIIGPPGILKSPAMEVAVEPIHRLEQEAREHYQREHADDEIKAKMVRAQSKGIEARIATATKDGRNDEVADLYAQLRKLETTTPPMRRYLTSDPTIEALGSLLGANPRGLLLFRDEIMGWLRTMDRDGHEGDRAFYLQTWSGNGRFSSDRVSRKMSAHRMCLSVIGGIQPGPFAKYIRAAADSGIGDDGFVQRFQLAVWPEMTEAFELIDRRPDKEARDRAYEVFRRVDVFEPSEIGATLDDDVWLLRFAEDAQEMFLAWLEDLERRLRQKGRLHPAMRAHLGKYRGLLPKLALLFHAVDCVNQGTGGPVSLAAAEMALRWCHFLEGHAARLYGSVTDPANQEARALAERILKGHLPDRFSARADLYRKGWKGLTTSAAAQRALDRLVDLHWLRLYPVKTGGRGTCEYGINPKLARIATDRTDKRLTFTESSTETPRC